jgi:hypothetical protein
LAGAGKAAIREELRLGVERALTGDWQGGHEIAQKYEEDEVACWLHAVVHRMEGDEGNARYWYRRCGRALRAEVGPERELLEIREALSAEV